MPSWIEQLAQAYLEKEQARVGLPQERALLDRTARENQSSIEESAARALALQQGQDEFAHRPELRDLTKRKVEAEISNLQEPNHVPPQRAPAQLGSFEDYVGRKYGENPTSAQIEAARKAYQQADDRPPQPSVSLQLPIPVLDKTTGQMTYATREDVLKYPDRFGPPPTTAERNVASGSTVAQQSRKQAQDRATPILQDLGSRITDINRGNEGGIVDRAVGVGRGVASKVGADPAVDLYRTGIRGFVPLFARAVGHTGVLTELDVQRTEELFPRVGDADDVTAEKMARIQRIMTGQEPAPFQFEHPEYDSEGISQGGGQAAPTSAPPAKSGGFKVIGVRP